MKTDPRHLWAVGKMDIQPTDTVLEIGCGAGITAGLVAGKLKKGNIVAVDRSKPMIRQASKRNDDFVKEGKAVFYTGDLAMTNLKKNSFTKIYAFNVNLFWKDAARELAIIKSILKRGGLLFIFYQPPGKINNNIVDTILLQLESNGFIVMDTVVSPFLSVVAAPADKQ